MLVKFYLPLVFVDDQAWSHEPGSKKHNPDGYMETDRNGDADTSRELAGGLIS